MSRLKISGVTVEDRGQFKKVVITLEGLVTEEEAKRCKALLDKPIYERGFDVPLHESSVRHCVE